MCNIYIYKQYTKSHWSSWVAILFINSKIYDILNSLSQVHSYFTRVKCIEQDEEEEYKFFCTD